MKRRGSGLRFLSARMLAMFGAATLSAVLALASSSADDDVVQVRKHAKSSSSNLVDYRVLATTRTSTMERELNEYARHGFVLTNVMGGETEVGGEELVAVMEYLESSSAHPYEYLVLATSRTGTMEREMRDAARRGFVFVGQTVYSSAFGGKEVVVVMERNPDFEGAFCEYSLLATNRTSTMEDELIHYAEKGFLVRDMSVAETAFGGKEIVVVTERCPQE